MYLTTTISVAMVLFLIGLECVALLSTRSLIARVKDDVTMTITMPGDADSVAYERLKMTLDIMPYTESYVFESKEDALQKHIDYLGEDPSDFLGYNPLRDAYELRLRDEYVQADSMAVIAQQLESLPYVEKVVYQRDLLAFLSRNFGDVTWLLLGAAFILLLIAQALIVNTIRLQIYSKRFLINTMTLVGATASTIKAPFVRKNLVIGFVAGLLALEGLSLMLYYVHYRMGVVLFPLTWMSVGLISGVVMALGLLIVIFASLFACGRYIRMNTEQLYEI